MVLLLRKLYLYFTKDPEAVHYIPGGGGGGGGGWGVSNFFKGGPNAYFYRNQYMYLLFSRGCPEPLSPYLDPHMGNVIITGQYLSQSGF